LAATTAWEHAEGSPAPLGVRWLAAEQAYNFALFAAHATAVRLLLYGAADAVKPLREIALDFPRHKTNQVWHCRVGAASAAGARYYAYRVEGPADPDNGLRHDPAKILLDPYARGVWFPAAHSRAAACVPGSNDGRAPLGVLPAMRGTGDAAAMGSDAARRPARPRHAHDLVIYELHVRGYTRRPESGVPAEQRGTFAGITAKVPYLKWLGVTAVELLPVHQFDPQEGNYWGYMTLGFFALHAAYAAAGDADAALAEFRAMVDALHAAGIEVFLDVVYNHTTEMGDGGPTYSFRGIDNRSYYALDPGRMDAYVNHSGCGNDLHTANPAVRKMVVDSLRYWAEETLVDGFRFDLASIFSRNEDGSINCDDPPVVAEISGDPALADVRLIAEPWAGDGGAYVMGRAFPGKTWRQWNDHYRNTVRSVVKGDPGLVDDLITRLYGSTDLFPDDLAEAYRPWQSVNFVDAHDGLNMADLVSYTNDGQRSWDCGHDGVAGAPAEVVALRRRQVRNFCALLMLANGTPMFVAGDEFMNTQRGDANPYNQDNETTWVNWTLADANAEVLRFFRMMIAFRKRHPSIGRSTGWGTDVSWLTAGDPATGLAYHLRGASVGDEDLFVMVNSHWSEQAFDVPGGRAWRRVIDTALPGGDDIVDEAEAPPVPMQPYVIAPRSIAVLVAGAAPAPVDSGR